MLARKTKQKTESLGKLVAAQCQGRPLVEQCPGGAFHNTGKTEANKTEELSA